MAAGVPAPRPSACPVSRLIRAGRAAQGSRARLPRGDVRRSRRDRGRRSAARRPAARSIGRTGRAARPADHPVVLRDRPGEARLDLRPFDEAELLASRARQLGRSSGQPDAAAWSAIQIFVIRFLQGALDGERPNFLRSGKGDQPRCGRAFEGNRSAPLLTEATHVVTLCEVGRVDEPAGASTCSCATTSPSCPTTGRPSASRRWPASRAHIADRPRAETLYRMLEPYSGQFVDSGPSWLGATTHDLALLAATLGRFDEADARFSEVADTYAVLGADPWLTRARRDSDRASRPRSATRSRRGGARAPARADRP